MGRQPDAVADMEPQRIHFIREWAEHRGLKQTDIVDGLGVDKATVSRWFSGTLPREDHLRQLAKLLEADDINALFRHPDDDWLARLLRSGNAAERKRIRAILKAIYPDRVA